MLKKFIVAFPVLLLVLLAPLGANASLQGDVMTWLSLRDAKRSHDFQTYARFLRTNPDWPESVAITMRAEQALLLKASAQQIIDWFRQHPPVTDDGKLRYITALVQNRQNVTAHALLREEWRKGSFNELNQRLLLNALPGVLTQSDHEKRLSHLIWTNRLDRAADALAYVSNSGFRASQLARIRLQRGDSRALDTVQQVPGAYRNDNGLLLDLARHYRQRGQDDRAIAEMAKRRSDVGDYAAQWWKERNLLARRALERGNPQRAYTLVKAHGALAGAELAEAEWFAGWLAVSRLKSPGNAYAHFERMYKNVKTPISVARASYWAGVAAQQMGKKEMAAQWYRLAAKHMNTFYGQMAAYALGQPEQYFDAYFRNNQRITPAATAALRSDLVGAAKILNNMGRKSERDAFLRAALREALKKKAPHAIIPIAQQMGSPSMALVAAKAAYDQNILIADALFPKVSVPRSDRVESALVLGVIRQESLFDPRATSTANARGLMQVLPGTARHVAKLNGLPHSNDAQLYQPAHNIMLGQAYLGRLLQRYDDFIPLAAAAYNAGPGNVDKWVKEMGDPRRDPYSWVDWVERIPFYETRNYVQRVWENYSAYKYLNGMKR